MVLSSGDDYVLMDAICNYLFNYNHDINAEDEFDSSGQIVYHPTHLDDDWLDDSERREMRPASLPEGDH